MSKYFVEIIRTYSAEIEVNADSPEKAALIVDDEKWNLDFTDTGSPDEYAIVGPDGETTFLEGGDG